MRELQALFDTPPEVRTRVFPLPPPNVCHSDHFFSMGNHWIGKMGIIPHTISRASSLDT